MTITQNPDPIFKGDEKTPSVLRLPAKKKTWDSRTASTEHQPSRALGLERFQYTESDNCPTLQTLSVKDERHFLS